MSGPKTRQASFPLASILGIVFITLKLTQHIDWSWWWVLSPFWAPGVFVLGVFTLAFVAVVVRRTISAVFHRKAQR